MSLVTPYIKKLEYIKQQINYVAGEAVLKNQKVIVDLVKFNQLSKGINSYGNPLSFNGGTGKYSPYTQAYADRDNVRIPKEEGAPYNFSWTGETLDNMYLDFVDFNKGVYEIETVKAKEKILEEAGYGEIFKLTEKNNEWVNENIVKPALIDFINREMSNV